MNLYQKLVEIQKSVRALGKNSSAGYGASAYQYVSGSKILDWIRPKMDELGLLLTQQIDGIENERIDYLTKNGEKSELLSKVTMTFTWIDAESGEKLSVKFGANGMNNWDKGLGSALTYAERYFLLKFFHIATDEDDVDALPLRGNEDALPSKPAETPQTPAPAKPEKEVFNSSHPLWQKALDKMVEGKGSIKALQEKYIISASVETEITNYLNQHIKHS